MNGRIDSERVEDRLGLLPDLIGMDPELVQERLLILKAGRAGWHTTATDRTAVEAGRGCGRGGADIEGHKGNA